MSRGGERGGGHFRPPAYQDRGGRYPVARGGPSGGRFQNPASSTGVFRCDYDVNCFNMECPRLHSVEICSNRNYCEIFECRQRHAQSRKQKCRFGASCNNQIECGRTFLHPPVAVISQPSIQQIPRPRVSFPMAVPQAPSTNTKCKSDRSCFNPTCRFVHTNQLCENINDCEVYACQCRHSSARKRKCRNPQTCFLENCSYLHQKPLCHEVYCLCNNRHVQSTLDTLLKRKLPKGFGFLSNQVKAERQVHLNKIKEKSSPKPSQQSQPIVDDSVVRNGQVQELRAQLQYFDNYLETTINLVLSPDFNQSASQATKLRIMREIYRLKSALPALSKRNEFEKSLQRNQFSIVIIGATGSGKSTQLPQYALESLGMTKRIICTQPRKVSAMSLAQRVASEWNANTANETQDQSNKLVGQTVGYRVGSAAKSSSRTRIEYVTEGTLLTHLLDLFGKNKPQLSDEDGKEDIQQKSKKRSMLENVGAIIVDEAHERSINCDVLLAFLKMEVAPQMPDLKIIITSATLDRDLFREYFYDCQIVDIPGRMFPVEIEYVPQAGFKLGVNPEANSYLNSMVDLAEKIHVTNSVKDGDILCFLTGQDEVEKAKERLQRKFSTSARKVSNCEVMCLYGKQPAEEQRLVFAKFDSKRKIIFATDVAETGITIDGVRFVLDCGLCKESFYDSRRSMTVLQVDSICRSSAEQRKGRAGRTAPGVCYRLYSEEDLLAMSASPIPEVLSRPLELTLINLIVFGFSDPSTFQWMQPPAADAVQRTLLDLLLLGALEQQPGRANCFTVTRLGKMIAELQIDPSIGRLVFNACTKGHGEVACKLAGVMSIGNAIFWRGGDASQKKSAADAKHKQFANAFGDAVTLYRIFEQWEQKLVQTARLTARSLYSLHAETAAGTAYIEDDNQFLANDGDNGDNKEEDDLLSVAMTAGGEGIDQQADGEGDMSDSEVDLIEQLLSMNVADDENNDNDNDNNISVLSEDQTHDTENDDDNQSLASESSAAFSIASSQATSDAGTELQDALEEERNEREVRRISTKQEVRTWCAENRINIKSLQIAKSTGDEILRGLKRFEGGSLLRKTVRTMVECDDETIAKLVCDGYFLNVAIRVRDSHTYRIIRNSSTDLSMAYIHPGSSLAKLESNKAATEPHQYLIFQSVLESSRRFLTTVTPVSLNWIAEVSPRYYQIVSEREANLQQTHVILEGISPALAYFIFSKGGRGKKELETRLECMIQFDEIAHRLEAWCYLRFEEPFRQAVTEAKTRFREAARNEWEEEALQGNVRVVFGTGYKVECLLFKKSEYMTLTLRNLPGDITSQQIKAYEQGKQIRSLEIFLPDDAKNSYASATIAAFTANDAAALVNRFSNEVIGANVIQVLPGGLGGKITTTPTRVINGRLVLSWPIAASTGEGTIVTQSMRAANCILQQFANDPRFFHSLGDYGVMRMKAIGQRPQMNNVMMGRGGRYGRGAGRGGAPGRNNYDLPMLDDYGLFIAPPSIPAGQQQQQKNKVFFTIKLSSMSLVADEISLTDVITAALTRNQITDSASTSFHVRINRVPTPTSSNTATVAVPVPQPNSNAYAAPLYGNNLVAGAGGGQPRSGYRTFAGGAAVGFQANAYGNDAFARGLPYPGIQSDYAAYGAPMPQMVGRGPDYPHGIAPAPPSPHNAFLFGQQPQYANPGRGQPAAGYLMPNAAGMMRDDQRRTADLSLMEELVAINALIPNELAVSDRTSFFNEKQSRAGLYIEYTSCDEAEKALVQWRNIPEPSKFFNSQPVRLKAEFSILLPIPTAIWNHKFMQPLFKRIMEDVVVSKDSRVICMDGKKDVKVQRVMIKIESPHYSFVSRYADRFGDLLTPLVYRPPGSNDRALLFSRAGARLLQQISNEHAYIFWDRNTKVIYIYGADFEQRSATAQVITQSLSTIAERHVTKALFVISRKKRAIMLEWKKKQQNDQLFKDDIVTFKVSHLYNTLDIVGTSQACAAVEAWLQEKGYLTDALEDRRRGNGSTTVAATAMESSTAECMCCFCPPEDGYYFSACDHGGCSECLKNQLHSAQAQDVKIPIACFMDNESLALSDIRMLATDATLASVKDVAVGKYLQDNKDKYFYCPRPNCNQILDKQTIKTCPADTPQELQYGGVQVISCVNCVADYCLKCSQDMGKSVKAHEGFSCASNQLDPNGAVAIHARYIQEQLLSICCPHCKRVFLDFSGCCAVTCSDPCNRYFCGLCLSAQPNSSVCHSHVQSCSKNPNRGNYFCDQATLDVIHRKQRIAEVKQYLKQPQVGPLKKAVAISCQRSLEMLSIQVSDVL